MAWDAERTTRDESVSWFTAQLLFRSRLPDRPGDDGLWEERFVLFAAKDQDEARRKAELHGRSEEHEYIGGEGDIVRWQFERIGEICTVEASNFSDGVEVFSRFLHTTVVESLSQPFEDQSE